MQDVFSRSSSGAGIYSGDLWEIPDRLITFADDDPDQRTYHRMRPVVVMQGDEHGDNISCITVLACPLSSNTRQKPPWEMLVLPSDTIGLRVESLVKVQLLQPFNRSAFLERGTKIGFVAEGIFFRIQSHLIENLGIGQQ